jgi:hypothetical protein
MGSYKEDIQAIEEKISVLMEQIEEIQTKRFELEDNIKYIIASFMLTVRHKKVDPLDLELGGYKCKEDSPTTCCVYNDVDEDCIICGEPHERK